MLIFLTVTGTLALKTSNWIVPSQKAVAPFKLLLLGNDGHKTVLVDYLKLFDVLTNPLFSWQRSLRNLRPRDFVPSF